MKADSAEIERLLKSIEYGSELVELGKVIGANKLLVVLSMLAGPIGMQVYIPSPESFVAMLRRSVRDHDIKTTYKGTPASIKALALKHGISKTRVRQIIAKEI